MLNHNPRIVTNGLVLCLDAANTKSYPGSGTIWKDLSGKGNDGTLVNGPTYSDVNAGVFNFDNSDDFVLLNQNINYTTQVSPFAWVKTEGTPAGSYHIVYGGQELEISIPTNGQIRTGVVTNQRYMSNHGSGLLDGNWHYVGFTFDGSTKTSYIDGVNVGTQSISGTLTASFANRTMGRFGSSTKYQMNGKIANAKVYNRALSKSEIQQNFNALRGRYGI